MKTWEMIKELTENPEKEFISYIKKGDRDVLKTKSIKGAIRFSNEEDRWHEVLIGVDLDREWEEVKSPIDFIELLLKVAKNGDFSDVEFKYKDKHFEDCNLYYILRSLAERCQDDRELARCILNGEWYIE